MKLERALIRKKRSYGGNKALSIENSASKGMQLAVKNSDGVTKPFRQGMRSAKGM